jgi:hypothetical protein
MRGAQRSTKRHARITTATYHRQQCTESQRHSRLFSQALIKVLATSTTCPRATIVHGTIMNSHGYDQAWLSRPPRFNMRFTMGRHAHTRAYMGMQ